MSVDPFKWPRMKERTDIIEAGMLICFTTMTHFEGLGVNGDPPAMRPEPYCLHGSRRDGDDYVVLLREQDLAAFNRWRYHDGDWDRPPKSGPEEVEGRLRLLPGRVVGHVSHNDRPDVPHGLSRPAAALLFMTMAVEIDSRTAESYPYDPGPQPLPIPLEATHVMAFGEVAVEKSLDGLVAATIAGAVEGKGLALRRL